MSDARTRLLAIGAGVVLSCAAAAALTFTRISPQLHAEATWIVLASLLGIVTGAFAGGFMVRTTFERANASLRTRADRRTDELRQSRKRYRELVDHLSEGVIAVAGDGRVAFTNAEARRVLGIANDDVAGRMIDTVLPGADSVPNGGSREVTVRTAEGDSTPVEVSVTPGSGGFREYVVRDVGERHDYERRLAHLASHDHLTGLLNRRQFESDLAFEVERVQREGGESSVLWLDLDNFKEVNDVYGHGAGDSLLCQVAALLISATRVGSRVARPGGDEFAVLLPGADSEQAKGAAHRLAEELVGSEFSVGGRSMHVTASIGVVTAPGDGTTVQDLLARADHAMYRAKAQGSGTFVTYVEDAERSEGALTGLEWLQLIHEAIADDLFIVEAQPIVMCDTSMPESYELLIRMPGPNGETLMPGEFLPVAERLGAIRDIDIWMMRRAVELLANSDESFHLWVNVSGRMFSDPALVELVREELEQTGVNGHRLGFEITETAAIDDSIAARNVANELRQLGCRLSLDDFGSGFASFYYLRHLPVSRLKIDGDFIRHMAESESDRHLVRAMVEVASALGVYTVAEMVETEEVYRLVCAYDIDYAQGFFIGRPQPAERVLEVPIAC